MARTLLDVLMHSTCVAVSSEAGGAGAGPVGVEATGTVVVVCVIIVGVGCLAMIAVGLNIAGMAPNVQISIIMES
jgi:hypothetical protein